MEAPTINKILIRKTLSSKKATPKSIRSVLKTPRENHRSVIKDENDHQIVELITKLFGPRNPPPKIPWDHLRGLPKDERKVKRKKFIEENAGENRSIKKTHKCFIIGLNRIIKKLESDQIVAVILDAEILEMTIIYNFMYRLCQLKKSPIILLNNLGKLLYNSLGIKSQTLGFLKQTDCTYFEAIIEKVKELSPVQESSVKENDKIISLGKIEPMDMQNEPKKLYLYRDNTTQRVFVPATSLVPQESTSDDFIAFSNSPPPPDDVKYVPMKVKKVISNKARKKIGKNVKK